MDTYTTLRHFADSWGLLAMVLLFVGIVIYVFRPGARAAHRDAADIPLRHGDDPEADPPADESGDKRTTKEERE